MFKEYEQILLEAFTIEFHLPGIFNVVWISKSDPFESNPVADIIYEALLLLVEMLTYFCLLSEVLRECRFICICYLGLSKSLM